MEPKRILFIIRSYRPDQVGGGAKSVQTLAEGLSDRGHDVHVLRLAPKGQEGEYLRNAEAAGISGPGKPELHILPLRNVHWPYGKEEHSRVSKLVWHAVDIHNVRAARDVRSILEKIKPDVVNTSIIDGFSTSILREISRSGAKLIHTMRDYYLMCSRSSMYRGGENCERLCLSCNAVSAVNRRRLGYVDLLLSNSAFVADTHRRLGALPPNIPVSVQWNVNDHPIALHARDIVAGSMVFGYIGRITPTKGVETLLEAAAKLGDAGREWKLLVAGDGPADYMEKLRAMAGDRTNVVFLGWVPANSFYEQVDVLICPSVYNEPLPRVIYEAYGFGVPVIASRVGGHPEIVDEGTCGQLYVADDASELTERMQMFREMPNETYRSYSESALRQGEIFTPKAVLDSFERHMRSLFRTVDAEADGKGAT
ncbi:glycosyltransferase family 4 protein [Mycolicibacterium vaccae]|uniref:glycosyltransferase family 4 protein n=1 Tax=Mycolicibacterium vaccae TaxID=1810 RepID=UPI003CEF9F1E